MYIVVTIRNYKMIEEFYMFEGDDLEEAKRQAQYYRDTNDKYERTLLVIKEDYENGSYDPIEF